MKPIIGITPSSQTDILSHGSFERHCLSAQYVRAVTAAGGAAIILPPQPDAVDTILDGIDGLILSGGPDIAPARYGDRSVHEETYGIDLDRDEFEIALVLGGLRRNTPIFGICRGIQVLNVALGGTLIQDVASQHPGAAETGHRQHHRGLEVWESGHDISVVEPALLPMLLPAGRGVNTLHHQAIRELAPGLIPLAYAPDGLIEAVAMSGDREVFAVQWHPELMFERDAAHLALFQHLIAAAAARQTPFAVV